MKVNQLSLGALGTNCYIISKGTEALIFDPGDSSHVVIEYLEKHDLIPRAILLTHAHFDHIGAVDDLRKEYDIKVYLHSQEHEWLENPMLNGSSFFGLSQPISLSSSANHLIEGAMSLGDFDFDVRYTPGHSPGSVSFVFQQDGFIVAGDTLFQGGIGRTDLPGGDYQQLLLSIKEKIMSLPSSIIVYPGHGLPTTIEEEQKYNPFL